MTRSKTEHLIYKILINPKKIIVVFRENVYLQNITKSIS